MGWLSLNLLSENPLDGALLSYGIIHTGLEKLIIC